MVSSRVSLGFYLLGLEHYDDAFATLMTLHEWAAGTVRAGMYWQADLAEAAIWVGRFDVAEEQREILADLVSASTSPWVVAVHDRVCAQLCDDLDEAATGFESAIVRLTEGGFSVAAARASLMLGERLRRARRRAAARGRLVDARRAFDHAGMSHWAARCDRELAAAGAVAPAEARTVAHAVLSPQELQVARWVVAGESNREIAGRLFLSPRTVEAHLSAIYRKLGVRGRGGLTGLGRTDPSLVAAPPSTHSVHTDTS